MTGDVAAPEGEVAIELAAPRGTAGTLFVPESLPPAVRSACACASRPRSARCSRARSSATGSPRRSWRPRRCAAPTTLKTALLRTVSHDLRSPLTAIVAAGEALRSPTLPQADRDELADVVVGEGQRLDELVDKLLDLSRLQAGTAEPHRDWCEIGELLHAAAEDVEARDPGGGSFSFSLAGRAAARPGRPRPARARLREPARERAPVLRRRAGVGPRARRRAAGSSCASSIAGRASRPTRSARVFDPFWRGSDDRRDGHTGLRARPRDRQGLRRGQRRARSRSSRCPGQGTTFVVELELARPARGGRRERPPARPRLRRRAADPAGAEGHPARGRLRAGRRRRPPRRRSTPRRCRPPDAAIVDLVLPDGDGVDVCRGLREWSADADPRALRGRRRGARRCARSRPAPTTT